MQNERLISTTTSAQCERLLDALRQDSMTTHAIREQLGIMCPANRVKDLRAAGYNIVTYREDISIGGRNHRQCARYVLLNGRIDSDA